jgi:DNA-binding transcriptional regulator YdaS (Cro superfamily)|tara:strand:- start:15 stop:230 length:216 start_codon:yes stop_codon:yes gene_type:complete
MKQVDKYREELLDYFGNQKLMATSLRVTPVAVSQWFNNGYIPPSKAIMIEEITNGKFKAIKLIDGYANADS